MYWIDRNALYTCDAEPRPSGALPFEAAYAGHGVAAFPVAGIECAWNATDGSVFSTLIPDAFTTGTIWAAIALSVAGLALLAGGLVHAGRREDGMWLPHLDSNQEPIG